MAEQTVVLRVEGMGCAGCTISVQEALEEIEGVRSAAVDLAFGKAEVVLDRPVPVTTLVEAVLDAGYEAAPTDAG